MLSARRSLSLFLAVVACLATWQVWLTWQLMEQDRNLELQRSRQRLEQRADLALSQLERRIGDWDLALRELRSLPLSTLALSKVPGGSYFYSHFPRIGISGTGGKLDHRWYHSGPVHTLSISADSRFVFPEESTTTALGESERVTVKPLIINHIEIYGMHS